MATMPIRCCRLWALANIAGIAGLVLATGTLGVQAAGSARPETAPASATKAKPTTGPARTGAPAELIADPAQLPEKVAAMRAALLAAARTGNLEALRTPLEWNELKPELADTPVPDPMAHWKALSGDGEGREILAVLLAILETPPARVAAGTAGGLYVWPGFSEIDLAKLPPPLEVQLYRLVSPAEVRAMREHKRWTWWRLSIGSDGTWHSFQKAR